MKREKNYNYAFLFYDVGEKRVQKVFKICKKIFITLPEICIQRGYDTVEINILEK